MTAPATIGRFEVIRLLGRGGMGEVFLARDPVLDREVAVKLISGELDTARSRDRLVREARAAGRLQHPNIVTIFDAGDHDGRPFIAMEFVRGETLGSLIRRQAPIPLVRRLELVEGACAGLAHAHRCGVVHLDIKPDNLMLDDSGVVKVLDFGIARVLQSGLLVTRQLGGTLRYMSPEQIGGQPLDHRSDVFSLGCALFEMIAFVPAFVGSTKDIVTQISSGPVPALRAAIPELEPRLEAIVRKAMALDRTQRYGTLDELGADLAAVRKRVAPDYDPRVGPAEALDPGVDDIPTRPASIRRGAAQAPSAAQPVNRRPRTLTAMLVALVAVAAASTIWILRQGDSPPPARDERPTAPAEAAVTPAGEASPTSRPAATPGDDRDQVPRGPGDRSALSAGRGAPTPVAAPPPAPEPAAAAAPSVIEEPARAPTPPRPAANDPPGDAAVTITTIPSVPPPIAEPAPLRARADHDAVRETLRRYQAAYQALDVNGVLRVYPSLGRDQAEQLRRTFAAVTQYAVDVLNPQIDVQMDKAVVRATVARRITPRVGNPVANEVETEFRLRRDGDSWTIVAVSAP